MAKIIEARVLQKIDTEQNWNANELILYKGEIALVGDPDKVYNIKVGNGFKRFRDLPYMVDYVNGLYTRPITPQSQVPSGVNNVFLVSEQGTYTNFGGVILPKDNLGIIYKNGNSYSIQLLPIVSEEKLQKYIDEKMVNVNVGFGGEITTLNQSPSSQGMYIPRVEGFYPNFGNLEYNSLEGFVLFLYKDNQFSKISIPLSGVESDVKSDNNVKGVSGSAVEKFAVKKINNISELRNFDGEYEGQVITLLGYYDKGDKEPLNYIWKDIQSADDGGSSIASTNGFWIAVNDKSFSFKDFGSKGDGVSDDSDKIQDLFNFIFNNKVNGINSVRITKGIYRITKEIKIPFETSVIGDGITQSIIKYEGNSTNAISIKEDINLPNELKQGEVTYLSDFSVRGILYGLNPFGAFDQERIRLNNNNNGIVIDSVLRVSINNVVVKGFESSGVIFSNTYYNKLYNVHSWNNKVGLTIDKVSTSIHPINCEFRLNSQGVRIDNSYANQFTNCLVESNISNYTDKISFDNNTDFYSGAGIVFKNCFMNNFIACYIEAHVVSSYYVNSYRNCFNNCFISSGSHPEAFPMNSMDGHSGVLINSDDNTFINNNYFTSFANSNCKYYFSNSKRPYFEFNNKDNFESFLSESGDTINALENKDYNAKAYFRGGNEAYVNGSYTSSNSSVNLLSEIDSPKTNGSMSIINGNLSYFDGSNYLTVADRVSPVILKKGDSLSRPRANDVESGFEYFDTTIKKPIYSDNPLNVWRDALGNVI